MEFLTLHELSLQFDISVRVLRHRLRRLITEKKFIEDRDYRREGYVDKTHFIWRVNLIAFMRVTGLQPVTDPANQIQASVIQSANQPVSTANKPLRQDDKTLPNLDTRFPAIEREMINVLKEQVHVKDVQIADLNDQNKKLNDLNYRLNGQLVQHSDRIQSLMRLTGGKIDFSEVASDPADRGDPSGIQPDSNSATMGSQIGYPSTNGEEERGSIRAA